MISIIIPVFNQADKLRCCLESILIQTFGRYEIIIVNDGSTDESGEVAKEYRTKFGLAGIDCKIIEQENKGAPNARNHGFQAAKGDYVLFCDADVILERSCLWEMVNALQRNPQASFSYSSFYWGKKIFKLQPFDAKKLKQMPYIHTTSLIKYKDFPITGWDEGLKRLQDWDLWLCFVGQGSVGVWIDKPLIHVCPGGTISSWLPSFAYKLFPFLPAVKRYKMAVRIVKEKHGLLLPKKEKNNHFKSVG
jgi:glycosyltransferase involved in cell wall biosynthesis